MWGSMKRWTQRSTRRSCAGGTSSGVVVLAHAGARALLYVYTHGRDAAVLVGCGRHVRRRRYKWMRVATFVHLHNFDAVRYGIIVPHVTMGIAPRRLARTHTPACLACLPCLPACRCRRWSMWPLCSRTPTRCMSWYTRQGRGFAPVSHVRCYTPRGRAPCRLLTSHRQLAPPVAPSRRRHHRLRHRQRRRRRIPRPHKCSRTHNHLVFRHQRLSTSWSKHRQGTRRPATRRCHGGRGCCCWSYAWCWAALASLQPPSPSPCA